MRSGNVIRLFVLVGLVAILTLGTASAAFAVITQTPDFDGETWIAGSTHVITWTSTGLTSGQAVGLWQYKNGGSNTLVNANVGQNSSYTVTVPADVGGEYRYYLRSVGIPQQWSNGSTGNWFFTVGAVPVTPTPASSPWSLAVTVVAALGILGVSIGVGRRMASSKL